MLIPSFSFHYTPDLDELDAFDDFEGEEVTDLFDPRAWADEFGEIDPLPVALVVIDPNTGEAAVPMLKAANPAVPDWYTEEIADEVFEHVGAFVQKLIDGHQPTLDTLPWELEPIENPAVEADDVNAALVALTETHMLAPLGLSLGGYFGAESA